jgi:amidase
MDVQISLDETVELMRELGMSTDEADEYHKLVQGSLSGVQLIPEVETAPVERSWSYPEATDNPLGAWYVKTQIPGAEHGRLAGRSIAVKDNVLLAGVPLMNGTTILDGYSPDVDAEIVRRMLAEGATITGKTVCEAYCFSGGSHTAATGYVRNPHNPEHSAGGSSSGSAVVVANGEADMAIGCDQGGSIRMPASFCGIVGMKPTWSLVPYTGVLGMNAQIDHTGPMTGNIADNALLLQVLAGPDGVDSRQIDIRVDDYVNAASQDAKGLRIGIVSEGFTTPSAQQKVGDRIREVAASLANHGVEVHDVSVPAHATASVITLANIQLMITSMFEVDGCAIDRPDIVPEGYVEKQHEWRARADELPITIKTALLFSRVLTQRFGYKYAARARAQIPLLRAAYDEALKSVDALVMPTTAMTAQRLPDASASVGELWNLALSPLENTGPFNATHHPALSVPAGTIDGLPVGMMFVGRHFEESVLYRLGAAVESLHLK